MEVHQALVEAEQSYRVAAVWNDRLGSALVQFLALFVTVVCGVAEHMLRRPHSVDQVRGDRIVVCLASSQQDGESSAFARPFSPLPSDAP